MSTGQYDPKISVSKGNAAAANVAVGGLPLAVVLGFIRGSWPNALPWPIEMDASATAIIASAYAWVQAWRANRAKHGGVAVTLMPDPPAPAPAPAPLVIPPLRPVNRPTGEVAQSCAQGGGNSVQGNIGTNSATVGAGNPPLGTP